MLFFVLFQLYTIYSTIKHITEYEELFKYHLRMAPYYYKQKSNITWHLVKFVFFIHLYFKKIRYKLIFSDLLESLSFWPRGLACAMHACVRHAQLGHCQYHSSVFSSSFPSSIFSPNFIFFLLFTMLPYSTTTVVEYNFKSMHGARKPPGPIM